MATKKTREDVSVVTQALVRLKGDQILGEALPALARLGKSATRGERMAKILRSMFDNGTLDAFPTSDEADEYKLRKLSGWKYTS